MEKMPLKLTREQREVFVMMGKRGGVARALALSPERRSQIGLKGAMARLHNVKIRAKQHRASGPEANV